MKIDITNKKEEGEKKPHKITEDVKWLGSTDREMGMESWWQMRLIRQRA